MEKLLVPVVPLNPEHRVEDVGELLLNDDYRRFLSLPVVHEGQPIGCVSRDSLQTIYMAKYGRELNGRKSVTAVMNHAPLVVDTTDSFDDISQYITANLRFPITEDFIITRKGSYLGIGHIVDLMKTMQGQLDARNSELSKAYTQLKSSHTQLVQSEKMASLGQMVAGVAHEINTPLGYVKNNISLARDLLSQLQLQLITYKDLLGQLASGEASESEVEASLLAIEDLRQAFDDSFAPEEVDNLFADTLYGVEQISEIVVNLRDFSRLDQAPVDNISLNKCLDSALLIARNVIKHKAEVIKDYGDIPPVSCSPSQINQVFLNLLTNAAQAMEGNGQIQIKTIADARFVHAFVQDNGKGIAAENLKKIFDPFFTTKPVGQGTGLGLSIAYQIIRKHGGHIRVTSQPGVGTRFCVSLPHKTTLN